MQRKDTVTMSGEEFDKIHTCLWLITDCIDSEHGSKTFSLIPDIRRYAQEALDIMDMEEYL